MPGALTLSELADAVSGGALDTVVVAQTDMQGRLMGKRFQAEFFLESAHRETHGCNYLVATDMEMETVPGYRAESWANGYGDYAMRPDLSTLRRVPWLEGTALVLCDLLDHHGQEVPHSPRAMLKRQVGRLRDLGYQAMVASELEFFLFTDTYAEVHAAGYRGMNPVSAYNEDYHIFQTTKEEDVMRAIRTGLNGGGRAGGELQGRGERRAGGDQRPLRRGADRRGRARDRQERGEGDRLVEGQVRHLHGEVRHGGRGVVEPPAPVAARGGRQARLLRSGRALRHVAG